MTAVPSPSRFAAAPVAAIAGALTAVLLAVAQRYGWHRDELYFLEAGKHLDFGYVDQPPWTPFVARLADTVAPSNLVVLRLLPAVTGAAIVVLAALIAREFGGGRFAQVVAAGATAGGGFVLGVSHLLSTATFDLLAWMSCLWVAARLLRTGDPRWWIAFGGVAGLALWNKDLVVLLAIALVAGLALGRRLDLVRSRWLVGGAVLPVVLAAPTLVWQATNGWPQFEMAKVLSARLAGENRALLLPSQLLFGGPLLVVFLWRGAWWLGRDPRFRPLLWAWPAGVVITFATAGRPYYALPLTLVVLIAGVVATEQLHEPRARRWAAGLVVTNAVLAIPFALPVLPVSTLADSGIGNVNEAVEETVGWPELVDQIAAVVHGLPDDAQDRVMLLTASYGEAGAIDRFGPARGLPPAYSPHNNYWYFSTPRDDAAVVVSVRYTVGWLDQWFDDCNQVATVDNGLGVDNEVQGTPIVVCRGLRQPWSITWPKMKFLA